MVKCAVVTLTAAIILLVAVPCSSAAAGEEPAEPTTSTLVAIGLVAAALLRGRRRARAPLGAAPTAAVPVAPSTSWTPKVSVVIPTYDRAHVVGEAVASVLAQSYRNFEIVVVDDGSTDDTVSRLLGLDDPRLSVLRRAHAGVAAARNAGIAAATGALIAFLDSDDLWHPDKLALEIDFLARHPDVGVVFSDLEKYDGPTYIPSFMRSTQVFARRLRSRRLPDGLVLTAQEMYLELLQEVAVKTPALTVRREALAAAGLFNELWTSSEDWELLLRLAQRTSFGYIDRPLAVIRVSPDSLHHIDREWGDRAMVRLLATHRRSAADRAIRAAACRGLRMRFKRLGWYYADSGRRWAATVEHLRGFAETRHPEHLLRAAGAMLKPVAPRQTSATSAGPVSMTAA